MKRMKILSYLLICFFYLPFLLNAQETWMKTYGGAENDGGFSIHITNDGCYIIAGYTESYGSGGSDVYLLKVDSAGEILWEKTIGGAGNEAGLKIKQTSDGGFVIVGYTNSFGSGKNDFYMIKTDDAGDTLWTKTYGGSEDDAAYSVIETTEGDFVLVGSTSSYGSGNTDIYVVKTNSIGDTLWTKTFGNGWRDSGYDILESETGEYVITGVLSQRPSGFGYEVTDAFILKINSDGDSLYFSKLDVQSTTEGRSLIHTPDGGFLVAGSSDYDFNMDLAWDSILFIKTNSAGQITWSSRYGNSFVDWLYSVLPDNNGNYIAGGSTFLYENPNYPDLSASVLLTKADSSGNEIWKHDYGGVLEDKGFEVKQTSDGGYVIIGFTKSFGAGNSDVFLVKTDPDGIITSVNDQKQQIPEQTGLYPNYPNPFNPVTKIRYALKEASDVRITVYNILGQEVITLVNDQKPAGWHEAVWDGRNFAGAKVGSGLYIYRMSAGDVIMTKKMVLVK